ncbi:MAG: class I SAM-dependent methyltransferase [Halobacteriota archaeon]|nr:class I SAM-dependent methyltransferase [Halobacteriota archaeon]
MVKRTREIIWNKYHRYAFLYDLDDVIFLGTKQKLRKRVMELARVGEGKLVLDLMIGTAESSILAGKAGAKVVGADFSKSMLNIATRKLNRNKVNTVSLVRAHAEKLPFPDNTFDAVFCTFGLDAVYDPEPVVFEMKRVAKVWAPVTAAYKSFPTNEIFAIPDYLMKLYFDIFWRCRNVELNVIFRKAELKDIKEEPYYFDMSKVILGIKPPM